MRFLKWHPKVPRFEEALLGSHELLDMIFTGQVTEDFTGQQLQTSDFLRELREVVSWEVVLPLSDSFFR